MFYGAECVVPRVPSPSAFRDGTYVIFTGMNDILFGLYSNGLTPSDVKTKIVPEMMATITKAIVVSTYCFSNTCHICFFKEILILVTINLLQ